MSELSSVTSDLSVRLHQHEYEVRHELDTFSGKNHCVHLVYWECLDDPLKAIEREAQVKELSPRRKHELITEFNPNWRFLNDEISTINHLLLKTSEQ